VLRVALAGSYEFHGDSHSFLNSVNLEAGSGRVQKTGLCKSRRCCANCAIFAGGRNEKWKLLGKMEEDFLFFAGSATGARN
jgi:hypothetical protein